MGTFKNYRRKKDETVILEQASSVKNYKKWILAETLPFIKGNTLEIGCGIGTYSREYARKSSSFVGIDNNKYYIKRLNKDISNNITFFVKDIVSSNKKSFGGKKFDVVVSLNVLEHIKNDNLALIKIYSLLIDGGKLIFLVPAREELYGIQDKAVGHYRRYAKKELIVKINNAGFLIQNIKYFNFFGYFAWFFQNKILKRKYYSSVSLLLFDLLVPIFQLIENVWEPPIGQSLLVIAKKTNRGIK